MGNKFFVLQFPANKRYVQIINTFLSFIQGILVTYSLVFVY